MFIVLLKFSDNKDHVDRHMEAHKAWLGRGFDDGTFLLAGGLQPGLGGAIVACADSLAVLQNRVNQDPFVTENVVTADILEISPARADPRLQFLLA